MTENVIIQILKDNKKNGIGWNFLPEQVKIWTRNIVNYNKCIRFDGKDWISLNNVNLWDKTDNTEIIALSEDFELKKESEGEWVEFEIRDDGYFNSDIGLYLWFDWQKFLKFSYNQDIGFTAFGGWLYDESGDWVLSPHVGLMIDESGNTPFILNRYSYEKERIVPVIPIKIRFWRKYLKE